MVSGNRNCEIKLLDLTTGSISNPFLWYPKRNYFEMTGINAVTISPNGQIIASGSRKDNMIQLWNLPEARPIQVLDEHLKGVTSVTFSADSKTLFSASDDKTIKIWRCD